MDQEINTSTQDSTLRSYQRNSSSSSGNSSISRIVVPETFSNLSNGKSSDKWLRISNAEDIRKNSPSHTITSLDLSYCKNLRMEDVRKLRTMGFELECVDFSGCQQVLSQKDLTKFIHVHPTLTKLKLHDWKFDSNYQKLFTLQNITYIGLSLMTPPTNSEPSPPVNIYLMYGTHLELTNFEDYISSNHITISSSTTNSFGLRTFGPFANYLLHSLNNQETNADVPSSPSERNSKAQKAETPESDKKLETNIQNLMCPNLQKLHLIFRKEMNIRELSLLLLKLFEASSSRLDEVLLYLPSGLYQHPERLFGLTRVLPELLPLFSFSYLRYEDDQIRRGVGKGVEEEREQEYKSLLHRVTELQEGSLGFDLNRGFEERSTKESLCDFTLSVNNHPILLHQVILSTRCPALLRANSLNASPKAVELLIKYLYSDVLAIPFSEAQGVKPHDVEMEKLLLEIRDLARQLELSRLDSICELLLRGCIEAESLPQISQGTLGHDLVTSVIRENKENFNDVILIGPQLAKPSSIRSIAASKFILMSRCPYFEKLFQSGMKDSQLREISLPGVFIEPIKGLVEYLYTNDLAFDPFSVFETLELADRMSLPQLKRICVSLIQCNISIVNALHLCCKAYISIVDDSAKLCDFCFDFFNKNALGIFQERAEDVLDLEWDMLKVFLSHLYNFLLDDLNDEFNTVSLQCTVLKVILQWVKQRSLNEKGVNHLQLRSLLEVVLPYIHTNRVSPLDFAYCLIDSEIFSKTLITDTFSGHGIVFEDDDMEYNKSHTHCETCKGWGYVRLPVPCCKCQGLALSFCSWCNSTGNCMQIGPACGSCLKGEVVTLKSMFDQKVLNECIRIYIPKYKQNLEMAIEQL